MEGGVFYEHGHRLIAAAVGVLTLILAFWLWKSATRKYMRYLGVLAVIAVVLQGVLGGITVLYKLPVPISVAHACLGQLFFGVIVSIALITSKTWERLFEKPKSRIGFLSLLITISVFIQLGLGAVMRHTGAGLAIPDFPTSFGQWLPPAWSSAVAIHFGHRVWGIFVFFFVCSFTLYVFQRLRSEKYLVCLTLLLLGLVLLQVALGAFTIWTAKGVLATTAHVACGALILATSLIISLFSIRRFGFIPFLSLRIHDFWQLGKPRITFLVCLTTMVGFYLAMPRSFFSWSLFLWTFLATAFVSFGASTLNQFMERRVDALMKRTAARPLPSKRIEPSYAFLVGVITSIIGLNLFYSKVNLTAMFIAAVTLLSYLLIYTPLKKITPFCTLIGAVPGAMPPLIGWAAASGSLSLGAWVLFAIMFLWQIPHFLAIGWLYSEDYQHAGFQILPVADQFGKSSRKQLYVYCSALVPIAVIPTFIGITGLAYFFSALILSIVFLLLSAQLVKYRSKAYARQLLLGSVIYLPVLLMLMTVDKV